MDKIILDNVKTSVFSSHIFGFIERVGDKFKGLYPTGELLGCRGYIGENILFQKNWDAIKGKTVYFNGTKWKEKINLHFGLTYIAIQFKGFNQKELFIKQLPFVHDKEKTAGVRLSKLYETQFPLVLVVEGAKYWKDSAWKIMLWTFYLKCAAYHDYLKGSSSDEADYWREINKHGNEDTLLSKVKIKKEIFDPMIYGDFTSSSTHHYNGFVAICEGSNKPMADLLEVKV